MHVHWSHLRQSIQLFLKMTSNSLNCNYEGFSGALVIWTTYAFNRSAIVCQAFSITAAVLPFLHIICFTSSYVSIRSCCSLGEKYAARVLSIFAFWFCDRFRDLFKNAVNVHLSKLYTPGLTYPRVLILAQQTCNGLSQDALIKLGQAATVRLSWLS